jgi:hypothetical protein
MTLQKLQQQVLQLPISERWQLVQAVLTSLQQETVSERKSRNLSNNADSKEDYIAYLTQKYQ